MTKYYNDKLSAYDKVSAYYDKVSAYNDKVSAYNDKVSANDDKVSAYNDKRPVALPPGPSPLPIIGNILQLGDGKQTVDVFRSFRKKCGDIFSLSLGLYWVIVVNRKECLREIFVKNGEFTSDRPPLYKPASLPPGPSPLPIIGNVLDLGDGKHTVDVVRSLRKKYGDIFCLSLGSYWVVVVNGKEHLREILVKNGEFTSNRPPLYIMNIFKNKRIISSNGPNWKAQRAFTISKLQEFGFGKKSFESSIIDELNPFLQWIQQYKGKPLSLEGILNASTANSLMQIILGKRFDYKDPKYCEFLEIFKQITMSSALNGPVNFMPWLANLPGDLFGVKADTLKLDKLIDYFRNEIQEHKNTFDEGNIRDFIDVYLKEMKIQERSTSNMLNEDQLASILTDLFGGGTETTATVIKWTILL
ncbi:unnamed protein product [Mytilus coruscus]|uniref:Uncharacterized protein n=1 Tax=Mytilus coruscus TaxID=42192 RepID=A0A6J8E4H4_MYTCO|nr:unnamed protein product [Mytilus coruscus]